MIKSLITVLALATVAAVHVDESVRYSANDTGLVVSIGQFTLDYLKEQYVPKLFDKLKDIDIPDKEFKEGMFTFNISNTKASLPETEP